MSVAVEHPSILSSSARSVHFGNLTAMRSADCRRWVISETIGNVTTIVMDLRPTEKIMTKLLVQHLLLARKAGMRLYHDVLTLTPLEALRLHLEGTLSAFGVRVQTKSDDWVMHGTLILFEPDCVLDVQTQQRATPGRLTPVERPKRR